MKHLHGQRQQVLKTHILANHQPQVFGRELVQRLSPQFMHGLGQHGKELWFTPVIIFKLFQGPLHDTVPVQQVRGDYPSNRSQPAAIR